MIPPLPRGLEPAYNPTPGTPYRVGAYGWNDSHYVDPMHPSDFCCGRSVWPTPDELERYYDGAEWLMAKDHRKSPKVCGACRTWKKKRDQQFAVRAHVRKMRGSAMYDVLITDLDQIVEIAQQMVAEDSKPRAGDW